MDPSLTDPGIVLWSQPAPATDMDPIGNFSLPPSNGSTPYPEMITAAITALGEPEGSSRQAIAKYIEQTFNNLPENNAVLLTRYLKQLKQTGQLEMVKHSYLLPGSVPVFSHSEQPPAENDAYAAVAADSGSGMKRRPGRPPKLKTGNQFARHPPAAAGDAPPVPVQESVFVSLGLVDEPVPPALNLGKRGRGRPPKSQSTVVPANQNETALVVYPVGENGMKRGPGRPRKIGSIGISSPPSNAIGLTSRPRGSKPRKVAKPGGRPRGRPRKYAILPPLEDGGTSQLVVGGGITPAKRRGRLPMAGILLKKTRRSLSGKPLGRPRKNVANQQTQQTHGDYTKKLEHIHLKVKEVIDVVKPHLNPVTASIAIGALQELEQFTQFSSSFPHVVQQQQQQQRAAPTLTTTHVVPAEPSPLLTTTHMVPEQQPPVLTTTVQEQTHFTNASSHFAVPSMFQTYPSHF